MLSIAPTKTYAILNAAARTFTLNKAATPSSTFFYTATLSSTTSLGASTVTFEVKIIEEACATFAFATFSITDYAPKDYEDSA